MRRFTDTLAALGGVGYVVLAIGGFTLTAATSFPDTSKSLDQQYAHILANPPGLGFWAGVVIESVGMILLVVFAVHFAAVLTRRSQSWWLPAAGAGLAVVSVAVKVASLAPALEALRHADELGQGPTTALIGINDVASNVTWAADPAWLLVTALAIASAPGLPRWLGVATLLAAVGAGSAAAGIEAGQLPLFVWLLLAGVWALRTRIPPRQTPR